MRNPAATDVVKAIKNFLNDFGSSAPDAERDAARVQARTAARVGAMAGADAPRRTSGLSEQH